MHKSLMRKLQELMDHWSIAFMETSHGMPSFTPNKSDSGMISKGAFIVLGSTRTKRVMKPIEGIKILSCICILLFDSSYPSLCKKFMNKISSIITFTQHIGSTRTPITMFLLMRASMYKVEGSLFMFIGRSCDVKVIMGDPFASCIEGMGGCIK